MNLAMVGPLPPLKTGIADYTAVLLPHLRPHFDRVLAVTRKGISPDIPNGAVDDVFTSSDASWWHAGHVVPVYQMGCNHRYHDFVHDLLLRYPGVTVLHDGNMLPFYHAVTLERGDRIGFVRHVSFSLENGDGHRRAWRVLRTAQPLQAEDAPMLERIVSASLGIVVHSAYMRDRVIAAVPSAKVAVIPHLDLSTGHMADVSRDDARAALGLDLDDQVLGAFGYVARSKRIGSVLRALHELKPQFPRLRLVCVGKSLDENEFASTVQELGLGGCVDITGYVPLSQFQLYLRAIDVGLNLRFPTWGESSGTLVRLMAAGRPVIVSDAGAFADLPQGAVVRIPADHREVPALVEVLRRLLTDLDFAEAIGKTAVTYIQTVCAPERVAAGYADFVGLAVRGGSP